MKLTIYCAHPISGLGFEEVSDYYKRIADFLSSAGYEVLHPLVSKNILRNSSKFRAFDYRHPVSTNHAIIERDRWMVAQSDIVYVNLVRSKEVSIGSCMELAWAHDKGKHTIVAMDKRNIHRHAFVLEAADIVFEKEEEAEIYLKKLVKGEI